MNTRNNQTGRSMVEMLGVLAIIGVLSVGGIAGYTWGMNKLRTNEILDGANKRAATVAMQRGVRTVSLREFEGERAMAGGTFASEVVTEGLNGQFGIKVTEVTEAVCESLAQLMETEENTAIRNITDGSLTKLEVGNCGESNEIVLVYNNDMGINDGEDSGQSCTQTSECGYCKTCVNGKCKADELCDNSCPSDKPVQERSGNCIACPTSFKDYTSFSADSADECSKCTFQGYSFTYRNNECVLATNTCPEGFFYSYQAQNCQSCKSGVYTHHQNHEQNQACVEQCKGERIITYDGGWGESCDAPCTGDGQFYDSWGVCRNCNDINDYWDPTWGDCSACAGTGITFSQFDYGDQCVIDCPNRNYGRNVGRCCAAGEIYTDIGYSNYGHQYGACCPATRPNWDEHTEKCVP